jgi:coenzyme PQQ synthesis protein D (PqqD)
MSASQRPVADHKRFLTEVLDDELLVYDDQRRLASRLNRTSAIVWQNCDGEHTVAGLVDALRDELGDVADEDLVLIALDQLDDQGLLESGYKRRDLATSRSSRRRFIRRVGVIGAAALALPIAQSVAAPPAQAATSVSTCSTCDCYFCTCYDNCYCDPCATCGP